MKALNRILAIVLALGMMAAGNLARADLVVNGGFETGDLSGWSTGGNWSFSEVYSGNFGGISPYSGNYALYSGPVGSPGILTQTISTVAGQQYLFSYALANEGGNPNSFAAYFDGQLESSLFNAPNIPWGVNQFLVTANTNSTVIEFDFRQDPTYWHLDNVSVTATPEPSSYALMTLGLACLAAGYGYRRRMALAA